MRGVASLLGRILGCVPVTRPLRAALVGPDQVSKDEPPGTLTKNQIVLTISQERNAITCSGMVETGIGVPQLSRRRNPCGAGHACASPLITISSYRLKIVFRLDNCFIHFTHPIFVIELLLSGLGGQPTTGPGPGISGCQEDIQPTGTDEGCRDTRPARFPDAMREAFRA